MATQSRWRLELLARMAQERSFLLRQLWALDEATIGTVEVGNGRTVKDIIAHIAAWDSLILSWVRLVGNGRIHKIEPHNTPQNRPAFNNDIYQRYRQYDLKLTLAFALRERSNLLYAFSQISDDDLLRPLQLPWGEETSLRDWYNQQIQHDNIHAQALETWRKSLPLPVKRQVGPKLVLRAILKQTRKELLTLVDLIPPHDRETRPLREDWTLKEIIGRLTDWEKIVTDGLRQLLLGQTPHFDESITDFTAFDTAKAAARRPQAWAQIWRDFQQTRQSLEDVFSKYPEPFLAHTLTTPWGKKMPAYFWLTILFGNDLEHANDIRHALNEPGPTTPTPPPMNQ